MRLTAQITTPEYTTIEHFGYTGPGILDEEDCLPLAEIERALEGTGMEEAEQPSMTPVHH